MIYDDLLIVLDALMLGIGRGNGNGNGNGNSDMDLEIPIVWIGRWRLSVALLGPMDF